MNMVTLVFVFILLDIITGLLAALLSNTFDSSKMRMGLFHKIGSCLTLVFGYAVDYAETILDLGINIPILEGVATYIILMEISSLIENICLLNPDLSKLSVFKHFSKVGNTEEE